MLKSTSDGLTKSWKVEKSYEPFFSGEKLFITRQENTAVCLFNENIAIVDLENDNRVDLLLSEEEEKDVNEAITCFCVSPDGAYLAAATVKYNIRHYDLTSKECIRTIRAHRMPILAMAYDMTGTLIATGSADRSVKVWDIMKGYCTHNFTQHSDIVQTVSFHPDPNRLLLTSTSTDNSIMLFDLRDNKCIAKFNEHVSLPTQVSFTSDGYIMASCGRDKVLNFYELRQFKHIRTLPIMEELECLIIFNSQDSKRFIDISRDSKKEKTKKKQNVDLNENVLITAGESGFLRFYQFSIQGKDISTFQFSPLMEVSLTGPTLTNTMKSDNSDNLAIISFLQYLPSSKQIMASNKENNIFFFSIKSLEKRFIEYKESEEKVKKEKLPPSKLLLGNLGEILDLVVLPAQTEQSIESSVEPRDPLSGVKYAVITNSAQVRLLDQSFSCNMILEGHADIVLAAAVSPDGEWLVTAGKDGACMLWKLKDGKCYGVGRGHTEAVGSIGISVFPATYRSRKAFMISGGNDKILKRWSLSLHSYEKTNDEKNEKNVLHATNSIRAHEKDINSIAISPNDTIIASGSQDKTIRLWDAENLSAVATLSGHKRGIWKLVFSPIDKVLASSSADRTVKLWSMVDFSNLRTFEGHTASVLSVRFINKGTQLISSSADGLIRLWSIRTGECENTFDQHEDKIWALATIDEGKGGFSKKESEEAEGFGVEKKVLDRFFVSGGSDAKIVLWRDATEEEENEKIVKAEVDLKISQELQNDIRAKRYDQAILKALTLGHSLKILGIFTAILEEEKENDQVIKHLEHLDYDSAFSRNSFNEDWSLRLDPYVSILSEDQIEKIVLFMKEWNTNARHSYTCQILLNSIFRVVKIEKLMKLRSFIESVDGLLTYTERHYQRLDRMNQASYLLEFFASSMSLLPVEDLNSTSSEKGKRKRLQAQGLKGIKNNVDDDEVIIFSENMVQEEHESESENDEILPKKMKKKNKKKSLT